MSVIVGIVITKSEVTTGAKSGAETVKQLAQYIKPAKKILMSLLL